MSSTNIKTNVGEKGFTLLELVVAMVIFLIVTGSIYGLLQVGRIDRGRTSRRADILKNARVATHLIGRDALNAGLSFNTNGAITPDDFLSTRFELGAPDVNLERDSLASVFAGDNLFTNDLITTPGQATDIVTFAFRDMEFNGGDTISLSNIEPADGDAAIVRLKTLSATGAAPVKLHGLYLVESTTSQIAIMATGKGDDFIDAKIGDPLGLNQPLNGVGQNGSMLVKCPEIEEQDPPLPPPENCTTYNATLKKFFLVSYRVKQDGTLVRISYGNNDDALATEQIVERPLAYNVEDLQIKYLLSDGRVLDNPGAGPDLDYGNDDDTPEEYNFIRQIMITVKIQATEDDEQIGQRQTITLNATFSTRNMEYDAG
ncbi:MAG: prepilin-type N-terminal cleavage/methylation domain-containing protein [Saprospiraceae bacterium]|nr:prepilin-type N-terminal cleavage/methylation domain-containing protein [Pyrinomonadaceae bacterium]